MRYFYISLFILSLNTIQASIYADIRKNVLSVFEDQNEDGSNNPHDRGSLKYFQHMKEKDAKDKKSAKTKAKVVQFLRTREANLNTGRDIPSSKLTESFVDGKKGRKRFHLDPVLNEIKRQKYRRKNTDSSSSSMELQYWKDEWNKHWMQKKFEALNSTQLRGDVVNMVAARPWGVPCGDPNQHDMPWGTCMLPTECEPEYRIFRGDYFCGRSSYICCALQLTNYDMYQGLDMSFEGSSFSTDSQEKHGKGSPKEDKKKKRASEKKKRKKERDKRKRRMKKSIRRIVTEIRKILNRAYRNGTGERKKKTKQLKRFIEMMKKQYRKDRKAVVSLHEYEMVKIDESLQKKLDHIKGVNENFMDNSTFRDIIVNGTVNTEKLMELLRARPDLAKLFNARRAGDDLPLQEEESEPKTLDYDLEYGMLYF